ncbi:MAG: DUF4352 domain-containing protein [Acidimicrobiales bacterium]
MEGLTCGRDGTATSLTCAACETPICPRCLVRTPVGLKCAGCAGAAGPARRAPRWAVPLIVLAVLAAGAAALVALVGSSSGHAGRATMLPVSAPATTVLAPVGADPAGGATEGSLTFSVTAWQCGATSVGSPPAATALGQFCFLSFTVRNDGSAPDQFPGAFQYVVDGQNKRYGSDSRATAAYPAPGNATLLQDHQLNPGISLEGVLVYDIPVGAKPVAAEFHRNPRTIGRRVDLPG